MVVVTDPCALFLQVRECGAFAGSSLQVAAAYARLKKPVNLAWAKECRGSVFFSNFLSGKAGGK
jgi:hypothetical protein